MDKQEDASSASNVDSHPEILKVAYEEICKAHHGIADFRAKLLAFLPIASGTGLLFLLEDKIVNVSDHGNPKIVGIGVIGTLVTLGLYFYELRGIQRCNALSLCGSELEQHFLGPYKNHGTFSGEPDTVACVGNTWAALIIYPTLIGAWVYLTLIGTGLASIRLGGWTALILAGVVGVGCTIIGYRVNQQQNRMLINQHQDCPYLKNRF